MNIRSALAGFLCLLTLPAAGCILKTGPKYVEIEKSAHPPIVRMGAVDVRATGSWAPAEHETAALKNTVLKSIRKQPAASYFSNDLSNLVLNLDITMDHKDDAPRVAELAGWSILSLGLVPLQYESVWDVRTRATLNAPNGQTVLRIPVDATGTYYCLALPWTPLTLLGAGLMGPYSAAQIRKRGVNNVSAVLFDTISQNYASLKAAREAHRRVMSQQPLRASAGGRTFWVRYAIEHQQQPGAAMQQAARRYTLTLYAAPPASGRAPEHTLVIGNRSGAIRTDTTWQWRDPKSVFFYADRALWYPVCRVEPPHATLTAVEFKERPTETHEVFSRSFLDRLGEEDANDFLLAWKNRGLPTHLKQAGVRDLIEDAARIEGLIVRLNEEAENEKDRAQKLEAKEQSGAAHVRRSRTLLSRIEILKAILDAVKSEATRRAG